MENNKKIRLYIVDDEPDVLRLIELVFTEYGYDVEEFGGGENLFRKLETEELPDIILLDIMMPGMNGYEVCESLKNNSRLKNIKVVLYSTLSLEAINDKAIKAGADSWFNKEVSTQELSGKIMKLLTRPV